jgi:fibronectin-binding autotransporter adhesin
MKLLTTFLLIFGISVVNAHAQSTTWIGLTTNWKLGTNWTNGVPDATKDAIIGDGIFMFAPILPNGTGAATCKNLFVGNSGTAVTLVIADDLTVTGNVLIGPDGTITHSNNNFIVQGNWTNNGTYTASTNRKVYFSGTNQALGGTNPTAFSELYVNSGSTLTLARNATITHGMTINGTFDPTETFTLGGAATITVSTNGVLKVKATTLAGNYPGPGAINSTTNTSVVEYASGINAQTVSSAVAYRKLVISGGTTKTLGNNITVANDVVVNAGILDLVGFTANRTSSGGSFSLAGGSTLRIGGTGGFPSNYTTVSLPPTSTVEYYGGAQTVGAQTYGHLIISIASGTVTKTMPATPFSVAGNFTTTVGGGGTLAFTALAGISFLGNVNLAASTNFTGGTFQHLVGGNWTNNGSFSSGCVGTITFSGSGTAISGSGTNQFGNVVITGNGTTMNAATSMLVCTNFTTSGGGTFTHTTGGIGTITFNNAGAKVISGSNIVFDDVSVGAGTLTTAATFNIAGDLGATGTWSASGGTLTLSGTGKTVTGAGAMQFAALNVTGTRTTSNDVSISGNFSVTGSYTASTGTTTFNGTSTFSGTATLINIAIANSSTLVMGGNATLLISGIQSLGTAATFDTSTNTPNTVNFNSSGAQAIVYTSFNNLIVSNGNSKTPSAGLTIDGTLTISATTTFVAGAFSHSVGGNFVNSGTFTPGTSTVTMAGTIDAAITGATSFTNLTVNKPAGQVVTLNNNVNVVNLAMTSGKILTGSSAITISATRTGPGIIMGTITRTHAYSNGVNYAFEGPDNTITFSSVGTVSSITVNVASVPISNFPSGLSINRSYTISVTGILYTATLRLHYEGEEVNGNNEAIMSMWNDLGIGAWMDRGKSSNSTGSRWVELVNQTDISNSWTMSDGQNILSWDGSASTAWEDPANWTVTSGSPTATPSLTTTVQIGDLIFTNQPVINATTQVKGITFFSNTQSTLRLNAGSLTVQGNIQGSWSGNAAHTLDIGSRVVSVFSDLLLSDGTINHTINVTGTTGSIGVAGSLLQSGSANLTFTGAAELSVSKNYTRLSGTFTPGTSTVTYNGLQDQVVADIPYFNLGIDKPFGLATTGTPLTINGNMLMVASGGQLTLGGEMTVGGDIEIATGTALTANTFDISLGGNWIQAGTFNAGTGTVTFTGSTAQTCTTASFNNVTVNKSAGTLTLNGNLSINGDINIQGGTVDVNTVDVVRTTTGGQAILGAGTTARFSGVGLQIMNFATLSASATSTIEYYGATSRPIPPISYGNLLIAGGVKTMVGPTTVQGNLTISTGATLISPSSTLDVAGNIIASGTFDTTTGTLILNGVTKTISITGTTTYNNMVVNGTYVVTSGNLDYLGHLQINGTLDLGNATVNSSGDLTNSGTLVSNGVVTFLGTQVQTLRLLNAVTSASTGVINFNGTVAPVLNSNSSPVFATLNINNTAPIVASSGWTVGVALNIAPGSAWDAGSFTHNIVGNFNNNGVTTSSGILRFVPSTASSVNIGTALTSTGKIVFGGAGLITLSGNSPNFTSIDVTNTNAAGVTLVSSMNIAQNMFIGSGATLHDGAGLSHNVNGTWTNNGTFDGGTSTITFGSATGVDEIVGGGINNFHHIVFPAGSSNTVVAPVNVSGNWTNDGTSISIDFGKVTFNGSGISIIGGTTPTAFNHLEINKGGAVELAIDASVAGVLELTAGPLALNGHRLTVSNPLSTAVVRTSGYVVSESTTNASRFDWAIGTDLTMHEFPFGNNNSDYIPFQFTLTSGDAGVVSVATYVTVANNTPFPPGVAHVKDQFGADNSAHTVDRFFQVDLTASSTPVATLTFTASPAEVGSITNLLAQRWNGTFWDPPIGGQVSSATSATVNGVTQFSPWAMSGDNINLPIELVSFQGELSNNKVLLQWETASELNNDYFDIQKSTNGKDFFAIGRVRGAGTSKETHVYQFKDYELRQGRTFYRLLQVDYDKQSTFSNVVVINIGEVAQIDFQVSPNPVTKKLSISSNSSFLDKLSITIFDGTGRTAFKNTRELFGQDAVLDIDATGFSPGVYLVKIDYAGMTRSYRVVKSD